MEGAAPGLFPSRDREGSPVERVGFSRARPVPQTAQVPVGVGGQFGGASVCGRPTQQGGWDQPGVDQSGALSSAKGANCPGTPLGPFEVAAHAAPPPPRPPFPACLAFQTALGFPAFSHSAGPWASIAPRRLLRGVPGHWTLSPAPPPRSLAVPASVSRLPLPNSSVRCSWRPFPTAVPGRHPRGL